VPLAAEGIWYWLTATLALDPCRAGDAMPISQSSYMKILLFMNFKIIQRCTSILLNLIRMSKSFSLWIFCYLEVLVKYDLIQCLILSSKVDLTNHTKIKSNLF